MKIDLENFVSEFNKDKFPSYYVKNAKIYNWEIAFVEIETGAFKVALDVDSRGNVWLAFRDYDSLGLFKKSLKHDFDYKTLIYDGRNKKYEFSRIPLDETDTVSIVRGIARDIIGFYNDISVDFYAAKQNELSKKIESHLYQSRVAKVLDDTYHFFRGKRLSVLETVRWMKENKCGVSRFGDGELMLMLELGIYYQSPDKKLMYELRSICSGKRNTLVCMPDYGSEVKFWQDFWVNYWFICKFFIDQPVYGDTAVSRPEGFYQCGEELADAWMELWEGKNVCIVTGKDSRLNTEHYLLSNIKNKDVLWSKNKDAYDDIDQLTEQCLMKENIDLFLIALGPAGTVLSARLTDKEKIAYDIGHLTNSYDTVFSGAAVPEQLPF
ncbi:TPA: GT-D fold domain-containing glycosyltransferase [Morganella morganii]